MLLSDLVFLLMVIMLIIIGGKILLVVRFEFIWFFEIIMFLVFLMVFLMIVLLVVFLVIFSDLIMLILLLMSRLKVWVNELMVFFWIRLLNIGKCNLKLLMV